MKLEEVRKIPWEVDPTPVRIVGTTFGNEIQTKILTAERIGNFLLFYIAVVLTMSHLGWFK